MTNTTTGHAATLKLDAIVVTSNVRTKFDDIEALTASVREHGILQPLLVRPHSDKWELVCGHRRLAAAKAAGLEFVPAISREMSDAAALEAQIVENDQREDTHPLDQARGYRTLLDKLRKGTTIADIAASVGRPERHVYDRLRLLELVPPLQELFRDGTITLGHAILLARLKPEDQERIRKEDGALLEQENVLELDDVGKGVRHRGALEGRPLKACTPRELQGWIDRHVRFDVRAGDLPQLFPETASALAAAEEQQAKVIPITTEWITPEDARDEKQRTFGSQSWRRADGKHKSKTCERSVLGVIVAGAGRGDTLQVCIDRKRCAVHFGDVIRKAARSSRTKLSPPKKGAATREARALAKQKAEHLMREARRKQWSRAQYALLEALATAINKAKPALTGKIADMLVKHHKPYQMKPAGLVLVKRGKTAEDLVRYLTFLSLADDLFGWSGMDTGPAALKLVGVDPAPVLAKFPLEPSKVKDADNEVIDGADDDE